MICGFVLRSLCFLRVFNFVEYLFGFLGSGLKDNNSYVRIIVVIGVLKLYYILVLMCIDVEFFVILKSLMFYDLDV